MKDVTSYKAGNPIQAVFGFIGKVFSGLTGGKVRDRNDLLDKLNAECADLPANEYVRLPWGVSRHAQTRELLCSTRRLMVNIANAYGYLGMGEETDKKGNPRYRFYYRRSMTGNWFAEIWSIWKSSFWATVLAVPFFNLAMSPRLYKGDQYGVLMFVAGVLLILCFLPRAVLGHSAHISAIHALKGVMQGRYGPAQIINWAAGLAGVTYVWLSMGLDWNVGSSLSFVSKIIWEAVELILTYEGGSFFANTAWMAIGLAGMVLMSMGCVYLAAAFVWYAAVRFIGFRMAYAQLDGMRLNETQRKMYGGSAFEGMVNIVAPQIALGGLVYLFMLGFILGPVLNSVWDFFFG